MKSRVLPLALLALPLAALAARAQDVDPALTRAHELYFEGRTEQARDLYAEISASTGTSRLEALKNLAVTERDLGNVPGAVASLKKAVALAPSDRGAAELLAWFTYLSGDSKKGAQRAAALRGSTLARFTRAAAALDRGAPRKAGKDLESLAREQPGFLPALWELGRAREARGDWEGARRAYEKGLQADFTYAELRLALTRVLGRLGKKKELRGQLLEVRKVDSQNAEVRKRLPELEELLASSVAGKAAEFASLASRLKPGSGLPLAPGRETSPRMRVGLGTSPSGKPLPCSGVLFTSGGPFRLVSLSSGDVLAAGEPREVWRVEASTGEAGELTVARPSGEPIHGRAMGLEPIFSTQTVLLHNVPSGSGYAWAGGKDREYRGRIELIHDTTTGLILVNDVSLPEYLYSVLPSEMPGSAPLEALKAQAVVTRTNALRRRGMDSPHKGRPYDLCDGQHCQVYSGVGAENARGRNAVDETFSLVLRRAGKLASALFQANCGGHTQTAADNDGWSPDPGLIGKTDGPTPWPTSPWDLELGLRSQGGAYCAGSPRVHSLSHRWVWVIPADQLSERVDRRKPIGTLLRALPVGRAPSGYLRGVRFVGDSGEVTVLREHEIRRIMAVGQVRSALFLLDPQYDAKGRLRRLFLFGGGWGHGVGLCQGGAANLASAHGKTFLEILTHYFTDTLVERWEEVASKP